MHANHWQAVQHGPTVSLLVHMMPACYINTLSLSLSLSLNTQQVFKCSCLFAELVVNSVIAGNEALTLRFAAVPQDKETASTFDALQTHWPGMKLFMEEIISDNGHCFARV